MDGWMDGWMDGMMVGWMDGWMDGWAHFGVRPTVRLWVMLKPAIIMSACDPSSSTPEGRITCPSAAKVQPHQAVSSCFDSGHFTADGGGIGSGNLLSQKADLKCLTDVFPSSCSRYGLSLNSVLIG